MVDEPLPTPGQRVSAISVPAGYSLPEKPALDAAAEVQNAYRQTQFVLGGDLHLFSQGMNLQLALLNESTHSRFRTHVYAAVIGAWSRAFCAMGDACLLLTRGSYPSVPNLVRSACELIAVEYQVKHEETREYIAWLLEHLKPNEQHKAFDVGLGHFFAGTTLAADEHLRLVYRAASDLGRPNFGATLLATGPESSNLRIAVAFADSSFHVAWAELELGWLLRLCERQLSVAVHMSDVLNVSAATHAAHAEYAGRVEAALANPARARVEEIDEDGFKRWLIHNFRRQPSGAPKKMLL